MSAPVPVAPVPVAPLPVAIVGTGWMARTMVAAMARVPRLEPAVIVSRDDARARDCAAAAGVPRHSADLAAILADAHIRAVYVANDNALHADTCVAALTAGKAVLCEKPFATTGADADRVLAAADASGALFLEALATPFLPAAAELLAQVRAGSLGEPRLLTASFGYPASPDSHPALWRPGGGVLMDRMVYLVTLARLALGPVREFEARVEVDAAGTDTEAALTLLHGNGAVSQLAASFRTLSRNDLSLHGTAGTAVLEAPLLSAERLRITRAPAPAPPVVAGGLAARLRASPLVRRAAALRPSGGPRHLPYGAGPYFHELAHFRDLLLAGERASPVLPPAFSAETVRLLDRARAAAKP